MDLQKMMMDAISDKVMWEITGKMWMSGDQAQGAIASALPMLLWGLSKNADSDEGAKALDWALDNHGGWIMDMIGSLAWNPDEWEGAGILKHMLWGSEWNVANAIAAKAWIEPSKAGGLLKVLAPMVMGQLGQAKTSWVDVAGLLQKDTASKGMLNSFLDQDGDGEITDDLLKMWGNFLKKKFFG